MTYVQKDRPSGPVEPLPLPPRAVALARPVRIKPGGWAEMWVDARYDLDGITWTRVEGGFGDGQRIGWHPREDWVALVPGICLSVGRSFAYPDLWDPVRATGPRSIRDAMRAEVAGKLPFARYERARLADRMRLLSRGISMLHRARGLAT